MLLSKIDLSRFAPFSTLNKLFLVVYKVDSLSSLRCENSQNYGVSMNSVNHYTHALINVSF